tara:strand:- start:1112 stop:2305 length:1194 start_codon:yes stop_codon:yes gene_type:complete
MKEYKEESHVFIFEDITNTKNQFSHSIIKPIVMGFKQLYKTDHIDTLYDKSLLELLSCLLNNESLYTLDTIIATEEFTRPKTNYTEASLVKDLEKKGIGRPSTFSNIVSKLLERKYVSKKPNESNKKISLKKLIIKNKVLSETKFESNGINNKNKLIITNLGIKVSNYMETHFSKINSYEFTEYINTKLDKICSGDEKWFNVVSELYNSFSKTLDTLKQKAIAPKKFIDLIADGSVKYQYHIDIYGVVIIIKGASENTRRINDITDVSEIELSTLKILFEYPKYIGKYLEKDLNIQYGPYGYYIIFNNNTISLNNDELTLEEVIKTIQTFSSNIIKQWKGLKILKGEYGIYIKKGKKNIPLKMERKDIEKLTRTQCEEYIKNKKKSKKYKKYKKYKK